MYNSLIVSISVKIWNGILHGYQHSIIKKIVDLLSKFISYLFKGSVVGKFFTSNKDWLKETLGYKLVSVIIDFFNKTLNTMNRYVRKIGKDSIVYNSINNLFKGNMEALETLFVFMFSLGIGLIGNNIIRGYYSDKSYIVSVFLIIISVIGILLKKDYKVISNSSFIYNFISSIFTMDEEGGDNWW